MARKALVTVAMVLLALLSFGVASATTDPLARVVNKLGEVNGVYPSDGQTASPWLLRRSFHFSQPWPGGRAQAHLTMFLRDVRPPNSLVFAVDSYALRFRTVAGPRWMLLHAGRLFYPGQRTMTSRLHTVGQAARFVSTASARSGSGTIVFQRGRYAGAVKVAYRGNSTPGIGSIEALATEVDRRLHRLR